MGRRGVLNCASHAASRSVLQQRRVPRTHPVTFGLREIGESLASSASIPVTL